MGVWLVTGGSGFLGRHVLEALRGRPEVRVVALGRTRPPSCDPNAFTAADLERPDEVLAAVRSTRPSVVIHTAGRTPPASSDELYRANTLATLHLLDALRAEAPTARVVLTGSAAELGPVAESSLPVGEDHPCRPADAYGLSKWLATCAGMASRSPLVMTARVFNPIGPGQPRTQALGRFADELVRGADSLFVGDLVARRDFVDARDVASALIALAEHGRPGRVYHVGTGRSRRVGEALDHLVLRCGRDVEIRVDPSLARSVGPRDSRAEVKRITEEIGWGPRVSWEQSLDDLWDEAVRQDLARQASDSPSVRAVVGDARRPQSR